MNHLFDYYYFINFYKIQIFFFFTTEVDEEIEDEEFLDSEENKGNSRKRRSLSEEYIIELMIVADKKMKDYHGSGLISYVLTLMSTVSTDLV